MTTRAEQRQPQMSTEVRRVLLGVAMSAVGHGLTLPLLVVYLGQVRGLGTSVAGLVVAYIALGSLILLPAGGVLVDRLGPRPVLIAGLVVMGVGVGLLTQVDSVPSAFAIATIVSIGAAFTWGPQSALLGRLTTPDQRQRVFGIQFMLLNLGIGVGGIVAALIVDVSSPSTFTSLYLVDALTYFAYAVVLLTLRGVGDGPAPVVEGESAEGGYREVFRDRALMRIAVLGLVLLTCGYGSLEVGLPVFVTVVNGLSVSWVAVAFTVNTVTIVSLQVLAIRLIRNRSRSLLMAAVAALWALSWLIMGLTGVMPPIAAGVVICLSTLVFAIGETLWAPIAPALINDLAPDHLRGRYTSVGMLVWGVSGALGPALAGLLLGAGLVALWIAIVVLGCGVAGYLAVRLRGHLTPALDGRSGDGTMPA